MVAINRKIKYTTLGSQEKSGTLIAFVDSNMPLDNGNDLQLSKAAIEDEETKRLIFLDFNHSSHNSIIFLD